MRLDYDLSIQLVNLSVDDFVRYCFDGPHLNFALLDVKQLGQLVVAKIGLVCVQRTNLHVALLLQHFLLAESFLCHQSFVLAELALKVL